MRSPLTTIFFVPSLGNGGAEMNLLRLLNNIDRTRIKPILAVACPGGSYEKRLSKDIEIVYLTDGNLSSSTARLIASVIPLRSLVLARQAHIVCSFLDPANITALISTAGIANICRIVGVQNTPSVQYSGTNRLFGQGVLFLMKRLYPYANKILALSEGVATDLRNILSPKAVQNLSIIHNAGFDNSIIHLSKEPIEETHLYKVPTIVACGRLVEQKAFSFLLNAFSQVRQQRNASLIILGEGEQRESLETQINHLSLDSDVHLIGFRENPYKYMAAADIFVLSSIFEGFGNVLVEAMTCGTAVISTDCPSGPSEIITHEQNGLLTPVLDSDALANVIVHLLDDINLRNHLALAGKESSKKFNAASIADKYVALFEQTCSSENVVTA
ncbi:glycosyltransferase [Leptothoe kymatousa]|uniref:Glycosyltransferase n=1 Tax=Leptothoe kymatousa TAU-MAC 1615 TaxID=2364775 RepID=A0ABS5Y4C2_9CYAN|nr:glycosyltransferase [Leptothoe kymatousa]MBT9312466.1 glycosyltransferase [Leptothoe kymatousa TAU-MAC 1615]